jgi:hypothetical protein
MKRTLTVEIVSDDDYCTTPEGISCPYLEKKEGDKEKKEEDKFHCKCFKSKKLITLKHSGRVLRSESCVSFEKL